jgi:bifunctional DNA-binding transcriptional regulator/antitoxin component of YhaV-PrlF toxin-antitoxin module
MKLQKQLSRKVKNKEYPKYVVTVPPSQIKELGWKEGIELEIEVENNKLVLTPKIKK